MYRFKFDTPEEAAAVSSGIAVTLIKDRNQELQTFNNNKGNLLCTQLVKGKGMFNI